MCGASAAVSVAGSREGSREIVRSRTPSGRRVAVAVAGPMWMARIKRSREPSEPMPAPQVRRVLFMHDGRPLEAGAQYTSKDVNAPLRIGARYSPASSPKERAHIDCLQIGPTRALDRLATFASSSDLYTAPPSLTGVASFDSLTGLQFTPMSSESLLIWLIVVERGGRISPSGHDYIMTSVRTALIPSADEPGRPIAPGTRARDCRG